MSTPQRRRAGGAASHPMATTPEVVAHARPPTSGTQDDIARRAYQLYERRGGEHGHDWDDWFEAERELRQDALRGE